MESLEHTFRDAQKPTKKFLDSLQQMLEGSISSIAAMNGGKTILTTAEAFSDTADSGWSVIERTHIQFLTFDGTNFRDWRAKAEQFFELESAPEAQRGKLLLLSTWM